MTGVPPGEAHRETGRRHARNRGPRETLGATVRAGKEGKMNSNERILGFALRAAGSAGVAFKEFVRWLSPFGWSKRDLPPVLRGMREEGLTELIEDPDGEILEVRLTDRGEREMASAVAKG